MLNDILTCICLIGAAFFFLAGTFGVVRFPDAIARLHAVTKADNLGLGLVVSGLAFQAGSILAIVELYLIWTTALLASATSCYLIASYAAAEDSPHEPP